MNKNKIFLVSMIAVSALLFLLRLTGMVPHIIISVLGLAIMIPFTLKTKAEWKKPALEILMRAFYGIALITGIVIMKVHGIAALAIIHKVSAVLFMAMIIVLLATKSAANKKKE